MTDEALQKLIAAALFYERASQDVDEALKPDDWRTRVVGPSSAQWDAGKNLQAAARVYARSISEDVHEQAYSAPEAAQGEHRDQEREVGDPQASEAGRPNRADPIQGYTSQAGEHGRHVAEPIGANGDELGLIAHPAPHQDDAG